MGDHDRRRAGRGRQSRPGPAGSAPPSRPKVDPARRAAWEVLKAVRVDDAYANLVLPQMLEKYDLSGRDAGFVTELASGALRGQGTYDAIIDACLTKPKLEGKVRDVLRLGVHQLLAMRVPDHAAIATSVELTRDRVGQGPTGLVNAVLRKVASQDLDAWIDQVAPGEPGSAAQLAVATSHPAWVVDALAEALEGHGRDRAELPALLEADNAAPQVTLVARPGLVDEDEMRAAGAEPTGRSPYAWTWGGGDLTSLPALVQGRAGVQDEGSQRVALALADASVEGRDERWLDLCAGPGGKSALLAALAAQRGAKVLANESQHHRAQLVQRGVRSVRDGILGVVTGDGTRPAWRPDTFDRALVDAPCSGLGALRRRPESRWRRQPRDVEVLVRLQRALLVSALDAVRPGGVVVYATCSPVVAETIGVVSAVLRARDDAHLESSWQLWPHTDGCDAMYAATLRRT
ncbi:RsmB/NOP family class I SAM-dependent RNA methyltransferase [Nocardioides jishulii]|uniref:rRNA cytosine-C5-methyltransferase n=1 Tax=Nocardioides jishulii TaxID=2575440 RepID=A0A4U2YMJ2_9ACTN|nr:transcription antitermination factor NusB [Nocardioides jishulii]QCX27305.1 rRNA cytosine-C5-methyltransferase [Nocardioides jishulii]TKI61792.1 rRNA cytosine-C5-methyltransferase [Nocardioides jishulii]